MPVCGHVDMGEAGTSLTAEAMSAGVETRNPGYLVHGRAAQIS